MPRPETFVPDPDASGARAPLGTIPNGALAVMLQRIGTTRSRVEATLEVMVDAENDLHDIVDGSAGRVDHLADAGALDARWSMIDEMLNNMPKKVRS